LIFPVAVKEVEAWLLAHRSEIASFLGVSASRIPGNVDGIPDPKAFLIRLAGTSRKSALRQALLPRKGSTAKVGPEYNAQLQAFVERRWQAGAASVCSPSLRALLRLAEFQPHWTWSV
jgi:hypothetical protein